MSAPTRRWQAQAAHYRWMGERIPGLDWSDEAAQAMFEYESVGLRLRDPWRNGYYVGKHWLDWQINEWRAGVAERTSTRDELRRDPALPADLVARV